MNGEWTNRHQIEIEVAGYDDGIYNLELYSDDEVEKIEISKEEAGRICEFLDEDVPNPQPTKPIQFE